MDRRLIQKHAEAFQDRSLRLKPYHVNKLGIKKNSTYVTVGDYFIYGVPFDISLKNCRLVSILRPKEIDFFSNAGKYQTAVHFEMDSPYFGRTVKLFMRANFGGIKVLNESRNYCMVSLDYTTLSSDYREIFVELFLELDRFETMFESPQFTDLVIEGVALEEVECSTQAKLSVRDQGETDALVSRIGLEVVQLFLPATGFSGSQGDAATIELSYRDIPVYIEGTVSRTEGSTEVPGYLLLEVKLEQAIALADILQPLLSRRLAKQPN